MEALLLFTFSKGVGKPSFTARIERPLLYRGGSASKKDGCLPPRILLSVRVARAGGRPGYPVSPFGGARCASTEDH